MSSAVMESGQTMRVPVWLSGSHMNPRLFGYALVDLEDWHLVEPHRWYARKIGNEYHAYAFVNSQITPMDRLIVNAQVDEAVRHLNGRCLDNRRSNLFARKIPQIVQRGVTFKGVFLCGGRFRVNYRNPLKQRHKYLGDYTDAEKAAKVWDSEARANGRHEFELNFPNGAGNECG